MHERAYRLDPLSVHRAAYYVWSLYVAGARDQAKALAADLVERWPLAPGMYAVLEFPHFLAQGDYEGARRWAREAAPSYSGLFFPASFEPSLLLAFTDALEEGDAAGYRAAEHDILDAAEDGHVMHHYVFEIIASSGHFDDAFALAQERIAEEDFWFRGSLFRPSLKTFRQNPRVMELFRQNGLMDYWLTTDDWPDYCRETDLPYDCRAEAEKLKARGL